MCYQKCFVPWHISCDGRVRGMQKQYQCRGSKQFIRSQRQDRYTVLAHLLAGLQDIYCLCSGHRRVWE